MSRRAVVLAAALAVASLALFCHARVAATVALAAHYLGLLLLFSLLTAGECCHVLLWRARHGADTRPIVQIARVWILLTESMPAAASLILVSGLYLIYSLGVSLQQGWLFYLVTGFAALAADGATAYTENVSSFWQKAQESLERGTFDAPRAALDRW